MFRVVIINNRQYRVFIINMNDYINKNNDIYIKGTSTFDGVSLASGVLKYIVEKNKSCCLFSTHSNYLVE